MLQRLQLNMRLSLTHLAVSIKNEELAGFILKINNKVSGCKNKQTNTENKNKKE